MGRDCISGDCTLIFLDGSKCSSPRAVADPTAGIVADQSLERGVPLAGSVRGWARFGPGLPRRFAPRNDG